MGRLSSIRSSDRFGQEYSIVFASFNSAFVGKGFTAYRSVRTAIYPLVIQQRSGRQKLSNARNTTDRY